MYHVLKDIFGFESFRVNSFEQLCINYCNEALQQQFNRFVLRNEQEEYDREGITWSFIDFPENQDVLDLIDSKGSGILSVLHDQCRTPGASDKTFARFMYEKCSSHPRFEADSRQVAEQLFAIQHYAGRVEYDVDGFFEKNRDELPKEGAELLLSSSNVFVKTIAERLRPQSALAAKKTPRGATSQRPTVGVQFSAQLHDLRLKIDETSPHCELELIFCLSFSSCCLNLTTKSNIHKMPDFADIRCLKPNNLLVPDHFETAFIADQLRCAGVVEAVRDSRLGYPQRYSHSAFVHRYKILTTTSRNKNKMVDKNSFQ